MRCGVEFRYKNYGRKPKTYHGVEFKPGEIHSVKSRINDKTFVRVFSKPEEKVKQAEEALKSSSQKVKKEVKEKSTTKRSPGRPRKVAKPNIESNENFEEKGLIQEISDKESE